MESKSKIEEAVEWYTTNLTIYQKLSVQVESILKEILKQENINYHSVTSRAKGLSEYKDKASKEKYKDPKNEIMDMTGIRVITYLDSDAQKVSKIIKSSFKIFPEHSMDKAEQLGTDKVVIGQFISYVVLRTMRVSLPKTKISLIVSLRFK